MARLWYKEHFKFGIELTFPEDENCKLEKATLEVNLMSSMAQPTIRSWRADDKNFAPAETDWAKGECELFWKAGHEDTLGFAKEKVLVKANMKLKPCNHSEEQRAKRDRECIFDELAFQDVPEQTD